jgi:hypothetical protein
MLRVWGGFSSRATKDIDLLGLATTSINELVAAVQSCLAVEVADDGMRFDTRTVTGEEIRLDAIYSGVRVRCSAHLGNARVAIQVDVGFGDAVTPCPQTVVYPTLLGLDPPRLLAYTAETAIAEKLQAMVVLDMANTRMKDFLDIWGLAEGREFSGEVLAEAIRATFRRRRTPLPRSTPLALTPTFFSAQVRQAQWRAYLRKGRVQGDVPPLDAVAMAIRGFVEPAIEALVAGTAFTRRWSPGGPWTIPDRDGHETQ